MPSRVEYFQRAWVLFWYLDTAHNDDLGCQLFIQESIPLLVSECRSNDWVVVMVQVLYFDLVQRSVIQYNLASCKGSKLGFKLAVKSGHSD
jgi:hypothetical protein